jgi:hypothetical protein
MPTLVTFFPAVLQAQKPKKTDIFDKIYDFAQGGGPGPSTVLFVGPDFR